jgi:hypothetical protein
MAKKSDFSPHIPPGSHRCDHDGCKEPGVYKAPSSKRHLHDYRYLCLDHVREYNKQWDYFSGMDSDEIEEFRKEAVTGHRPTWAREKIGSPSPDKLSAKLDEFLHFAGKRKGSKPKIPVSNKIRKALDAMDLDYPYTKSTLKLQYKRLVKAYHPDHNQGDKLAEEKFKSVAVAYKILTEHLESHPN